MSEAPRFFDDADLIDESGDFEEETPRLTGEIDFSSIAIPQEFLDGLSDDEKVVVRVLFEATLMRYHSGDLVLSNAARPEIIEQLANTARNALRGIDRSLKYWENFIPLSSRADDAYDNGVNP